MSKSFEDYGIYLPPGATGDTAILCPRCSHTRSKNKHDRCLSVNVDEGVWKCHHPHCGWTGTLRENDSRGGDRKVRKPLSTSSKQMPTVSYKVPKAPDSGIGGEGSLPEPHTTWLKSRGISEETSRFAKLTTEKDNIRFPYFRNGVLCNYKYRSIKEKRFFLEKGCERILLGMDVAKLTGDDTLVWVEGEMDVLSFYEAGVQNVVSVPDGAPAENTKDYASKFSFLETAEDFVLGFKTHIIAVDSDGPGVKLGEELSRRIGPERCKIVAWPAGCKDANDVLLGHGAEALRDVVQAARDYPIRGIHEVKELVDDIYRLYEEGDEPGMSTGYSNLDQIYTARAGELTVVTGVPNHGKSEWLDDLMVNLARLHHWRFGICSPENRPLRRHFTKLAQKYKRKPFFPGRSERMDHKELADAVAWGHEHFTFVLPEEDNMTIDNILDLGRVLVYRKGIQGLVIDPWGDMVHKLEPGENETHYIGRKLTQIRQFARDHNVHVWIVAHPKQLHRSGDSGNFPIPTPYDISGSAHWRNKPDNCLCVWREDTLNKEAGGGDDTVDGDAVEIHVQKVRFREVGRQGKRPLYYDRVTGVYYANKEKLISARRARKKVSVTETQEEYKECLKIETGKASLFSLGPFGETKGKTGKTIT